MPTIQSRIMPNSEQHPNLLFVHANGFTPGAYRRLLDAVADIFTVSAVELAPLRPDATPHRSWRRLAAEIAAETSDRATPLVGVGHSLGAVMLLLAASANPERFARLVLIEPVALPGWMATLLQYAPASVRRRGPLATSARKRADRWPSYEAAFEAERRRRWLSRVPDAVLHDILRDGLIETTAGVTLRYPKEWEATLYESPANIWPLLRKHLPPITVLHGAESSIFDRAATHRWRRLRPTDTFVEISGSGHLLPFEQPEAVVEVLRHSSQQMV